MPALSQRLGLTRYEADEYYRQALEAYRKDDFDAAVAAMNSALEALPTKSEYYAARGLFQLEDGALAEARADFEKALSLFPVEMLAHYGLGLLAYKDEDWDAAIAHWTAAYHADESRAETLFALGLAHLRSGDAATALNALVLAREAFERAGDRRKTQADRLVRELSRGVGRVPGLS